VKPKWVEVETEVETEAAIGVDRAKDVTKVAKSPEDLGDQDHVQDLDRERVHQNDIAGITKAVDITLDVIEDVLAQIQTIPPVQIQIVKQPTKSELFL